jgi:polyferredoxin
MKRQNLRKLLLIITLLLFPITLYYFSPYLIIQAGTEGIINGSFCVFAAMLIGSIFFGRVFCGYLCPAGGLQDCASQVNYKEPKKGFRSNIKYVIWVVWLTGVVLSFIFRSKEISVDFFYQTNHGISISNIYGFIMYYGVVMLIFLPAIIGGRRSFCHYFCWMAPFMMIGSKIGKLLHIKQLSLEAKKDACVNCKACNKQCPMSLQVSEKVQKGKMEDRECILCGACVDTCPKKAIRYRFH